MKLVYIIAQGHTGSTLLDCILGTHPEFISNGELMYLNWQLERTKDSGNEGKEDVCTCLKDFRLCEYWSEVFKMIEEKSGKNIAKEPQSFDTAYFGRFSYNQRGGFKVSKKDKANEIKAYKSVLRGENFKELLRIEPKLKNWVENNWLLYESMSTVANKSVVIDSSKNFLRMMLLQMHRPKDVFVIFINRDPRGLTSSIKRIAKKKNRPTWLALPYVIYSKLQYRSKIFKIKKGINDLSYLEVDYNYFVSRPSDFINIVLEKLELTNKYKKQLNENFYIDPSQQHLVAGNPMRFKGPQKVRFDERWRNSLNKLELFILKILFGKSK